MTNADGSGYRLGEQRSQPVVPSETVGQEGGILDQEIEDMKWLSQMYLDALREWEKKGELGELPTYRDAGVSSVGMLESRGEEWGFKVTHVDTPMSDIPKENNAD